MKSTETSKKLLTVFNTLLAAFGPRHWWPGDSPLEVMIGAILTQNTSWSNVEKAITNMKGRGLLSFEALIRVEEDDLAEVVRPAGYFRVKAHRLKSFVLEFEGRFGDSIEAAAPVPTPELRDWLLAIKGIGPETADSILLYALQRPVFVVDAYTKRFLERHELYNGDYEYHDIQRFFMDNLPEDTYIYNEFHALLVHLCKEHCKKKADCAQCPLSESGESRLDVAGTGG